MNVPEGRRDSSVNVRFKVVGFAGEVHRGFEIANVTARDRREGQQRANIIAAASGTHPGEEGEQRAAYCFRMTCTASSTPANSEWSASSGSILMKATHSLYFSWVTQNGDLPNP